MHSDLLEKSFRGRVRGGFRSLGRWKGSGEKATCMGLILVLREKALDVDDGVSARDCLEMITLGSQSGTNERNTEPSSRDCENFLPGNADVAYNSALCTTSPRWRRRRMPVIMPVWPGC
jgi:hypothetical protein